MRLRYLSPIRAKCGPLALTITEHTLVNIIARITTVSVDANF
jgi:hypothetical protein